MLFEVCAMKKSTHKAMRVIETIIPGLGVARIYQRSWLWADLFAGITNFAMLVPQAMANSRGSLWSLVSIRPSVDWLAMPSLAVRGG